MHHSPNATMLILFLPLAITYSFFVPARAPVNFLASCLRRWSELRLAACYAASYSVAVAVIATVAFSGFDHLMSHAIVVVVAASQGRIAAGPLFCQCLTSQHHFLLPNHPFPDRGSGSAQRMSS